MSAPNFNAGHIDEQTPIEIAVGKSIFMVTWTQTLIHRGANHGYKLRTKLRCRPSFNQSFYAEQILKRKTVNS